MISKPLYSLGILAALAAVSLAACQKPPAADSNVANASADNTLAPAANSATTDNTMAPADNTLGTGSQDNTNAHP